MSSRFRAGSLARLMPGSGPGWTSEKTRSGSVRGCFAGMPIRPRSDSSFPGAQSWSNKATILVIP
jgi:hypothetical protein